LSNLRQVSQAPLNFEVLQIPLLLIHRYFILVLGRLPRRELVLLEGVPLLGHLNLVEGWYSLQRLLGLLVSFMDCSNGLYGLSYFIDGGSEVSLFSRLVFNLE